jgi:hypothetical protein
MTAQAAAELDIDAVGRVGEELSAQGTEDRPNMPMVAGPKTRTSSVLRLRPSFAGIEPQKLAISTVAPGSEPTLSGGKDAFETIVIQRHLIDPLEAKA